MDEPQPPKPVTTHAWIVHSKFTRPAQPDPTGRPLTIVSDNDSVTHADNRHTKRTLWQRIKAALTR